MLCDHGASPFRRTSVAGSTRLTPLAWRTSVAGSTRGTADLRSRCGLDERYAALVARRPCSHWVAAKKPVAALRGLELRERSYQFSAELPSVLHALIRRKAELIHVEPARQFDLHRMPAQRRTPVVRSRMTAAIRVVVSQGPPELVRDGLGDCRHGLGTGRLAARARNDVGSSAACIQRTWLSPAWHRVRAKQDRESKFASNIS